MDEDIRPPKVDGDELTTLLAALGYLRDSVVRKIEHLSEEEARRSLVESETTLLGLIQHLTFAETFWFDFMFLGVDDPLPDRSMIVGDHLAVAEVVAVYVQRGEASDQIAGAASLDRHSVLPYETGETVTLRWILVHLIEETARHAGHADILRELLDGTTGR